MKLKFLLGAVAATGLVGCQTATSPQAAEQAVAGSTVNTEALNEIVASRPDEKKARDEWRNPVETLAFFELEPDDFVVEVLPGGGWYTDIIAPYVAKEGRYGATMYSLEMYAQISSDQSEETVAKRRAFPTSFPAKVSETADFTNPAMAYHFGSAPEDIKGQVDKVLFIRALHNFNRAENDSFRNEMLEEVMSVLKPGGTVGIVQHRAPETAEGAAADGQHGYITEANVKSLFENAGFEFVAASEINANPNDKPGANDYVWRLAPTFYLDKENKEANAKIGESDRMTMVFRKPA